MLIKLENERYVSGAAVVSAVMRSSLTPVPLTFEALIRLDEEIAPHLLEDKLLFIGRFATPVVIKYIQDSISTLYQDGVVQIRHIIAVHASVHTMIHAATRGIFLENTNLSQIYQACGGKSTINKDFAVERFYCFKGDLPTAQVQQICQEYGGVVRWIPDNNSIEFTRIYDLFQQKPKIDVDTQILADHTQKSGFLERHEISSYISTGANGGFIQGNFDKPRNIIYVPDKTEAQLRNMTSVLINAKEVPSRYSPNIQAGDLIITGNTQFVVITAAHSFNQQTGEESMSKFWLGVKA